MSASGATAGLLPAKGATLDIFGRKISWDALLVAGAGLAGVIFLYKYGQGGGSISPMSTVGSSGGGGDTGTTGTVPSGNPIAGPGDNSPYAGSNPYQTSYYSGGAGATSGGGASTPAPTQQGGFVPVQGTTYSVPVASSSYMPSGQTGLVAGPTSSAPAPTVSSAPSSGGPSIGFSQGGYVAPSPSSPPPPATAPVPAAPGGGGAFAP